MDMYFHILSRINDGDAIIMLCVAYLFKKLRKPLRFVYDVKRIEGEMLLEQTTAEKRYVNTRNRSVKEHQTIWRRQFSVARKTEQLYQSEKWKRKQKKKTKILV